MKPDAREPFKFSIIMPTYRRPHTLPGTVQGVLAQTYRNWELIIIDNAGDGGYCFNDPRIRVYCRSRKASSSYARNRGLDYAGGDLVCFVDDDDEMFPNYLQRFAETFRSHPRAKMVRCWMTVRQGLVDTSYATPECCLRREYGYEGDEQEKPRQFRAAEQQRCSAGSLLFVQLNLRDETDLEVFRQLKEFGV